MTDKQAAAALLSSLLWGPSPSQQQIEEVCGEPISYERQDRIVEQFCMLKERVRLMIGRDYLDGR